MSNNLYHHEEIYRGEVFLDRLAQTHIFVCGCGALGSNLIDNLVRQGAKTISVVDKDRVEKHNINTQIWDEYDIGMTKANAIANKVLNVAGIDIATYDKELTSKNIKKFTKNCDLVIDCFDNSASRQLVYDFCKDKIPCLHGGLYEDFGEVCWNDQYKVPDDQEDGDICDYPLARNIVMLTVLAMTEEILSFCEEPRYGNWNITLRDLSIKQR